LFINILHGRSCGGWTLTWSHLHTSYRGRKKRGSTSTVPEAICSHKISVRGRILGFPIYPHSPLPGWTCNVGQRKSRKAGGFSTYANVNSAYYSPLTRYVMKWHNRRASRIMKKVAHFLTKRRAGGKLKGPRPHGCKNKKAGPKMIGHTCKGTTDMHRAHIADPTGMCALSRSGLWCLTCQIVAVRVSFPPLLSWAPMYEICASATVDYFNR
jgi:hypothetical protein